jgi:FtsP/CotA-like multicopper oxidase with cupredoxin domain
MGIAERADVIVDFTNVPVGEYVLRNVGPDEPFPDEDEEFPMADPSTTGQVLQFRVRPPIKPDPTTPPQFLKLPQIRSLPPETGVRRVALLEDFSAVFEDAPTQALLGVVSHDPNLAPGVWRKRGWSDEVTETPQVGATEVWELYNTTGDAHPIHIHEVVFEILNRQAILVDEVNRTVEVDSGSEKKPPKPWEAGFKDTVIAYPGQVTRVRVRFNTPGQFSWHCHILEHEDNEMMRPYRIGAVQPGQPRG